MTFRHRFLWLCAQRLYRQHCSQRRRCRNPRRRSGSGNRARTPCATVVPTMRSAVTTRASRSIRSWPATSSPRRTVSRAETTPRPLAGWGNTSCPAGPSRRSSALRGVAAASRKLPECRVQLERFIADVQDRDDANADHLLDCHTKLVQLAAAGDDEYGEHLNRGIGLYLLAGQRALLPDAADGLSARQRCARRLRSWG